MILIDRAMGLEQKKGTLGPGQFI